MIKWFDYCGKDVGGRDVGDSCSVRKVAACHKREGSDALPCHSLFMLFIRLTYESAQITIIMFEDHICHRNLGFIIIYQQGTMIMLIGSEVLHRCQDARLGSTLMEWSLFSPRIVVPSITMALNIAFLPVDSSHLLKFAVADDLLGHVISGARLNREIAINN